MPPGGSKKFCTSAQTIALSGEMLLLTKRGPAGGEKNLAPGLCVYRQQIPAPLPQSPRSLIIAKILLLLLEIFLST